MASRDLAITNRPRSADRNVLRPAASIRAGLVLAALVLGVIGAVAHADNTASEPQQPDANAQRTAQNPPPARVILPAPWEQATPAPSAAAPVATTGRK